MRAEEILDHLKDRGYEPEMVSWWPDRKQCVIKIGPYTDQFTYGSIQGVGSAHFWMVVQNTARKLKKKVMSDEARRFPWKIVVE